MASIMQIKGKTVYVETLEDLREFLPEEVYEALGSIYTREKEIAELEEALADRKKMVATLEEEIIEANKNTRALDQALNDALHEIDSLEYEFATKGDTGE